MVWVLQVMFPDGERTPSPSRVSLMVCRLSPLRKSWAMSRMTRASSGTIAGFPSAPFR